MADRSRAGRLAAICCGLRLGWGLALVAAPGAVLRRTGADLGDDPFSRAVVRALGLRQATQAVLTLALAPGHPHAALELGLLADLSHGASDVAVSARPGRWRRAAAIDAALAGIFVVADLGSRPARVSAVGATGREPPQLRE